MAEKLVEDLVTGLTGALQGCRFTPSGRSIRLERFSGQGGISLTEWLEEIDLYCEQYQISETQKCGIIRANLEGAARKGSSISTFQF